MICRDARRGAPGKRWNRTVEREPATPIERDPGHGAPAQALHRHRTPARGELNFLFLGGRRYLNHLSDLLFVIARVLNRAASRPDVLWQQGKNRD